MSVIHEIIAPKENADDTLLVSRIYFTTKDRVKKQDELIDLETSKTAIIIDSPADGYVEYLVGPKKSVDVGEVIIRIHDNLSSIGENSEIYNKNLTVSQPNINHIISNKAKEFIQKYNVDISGINKTFICLNDLTNDELSVKSELAYVGTKSKLSSLDANLKVSEKSLSLAKQTEIYALLDVQSSGLVSTIFFNVDVDNLPKSENLIINSAGSFLPIVSFEAAKLLGKYPALNAYFEHNSIMEYVDVNIGVAIDIDDGLKVYTIKNSDRLTLKELEYEISQGIYSYFRKDLKTEQIKGSTFTITDLSSLGVDRFVPLINYKQSAILGISAFDNKLNRFTLCLSFDHRVTEGKVASKFLAELSENIKSHTEI